MANIVKLNSTSESILYLSKKDKRLAKLFAMIGEITYVPYQDDPFQFLVNTIIGQMLSQKAADSICKRVHSLCNEKVTPANILSLSHDELRSAGVSNSKCKYLFNLAEATQKGILDFNTLQSLDDQAVYKTITSIQGLGSWSAKMYLIFVLNRQNILPFEDGAFLQSYSWLYKTNDISPSSIKKRCKKWEPYSSIASRYLYKALDYGLTKEEFHLYK